MNNQTKKAISLLLVLVQLFVLFPALQPQAEAAQSEPEVPVLNETVVGTVKFQSFNFLGNNAAGEDGTDYSSTFYYSDDYFSPSAINVAADRKTMLWSDLDNPSLAACSMDFAVAAMTSAKDDVLRDSSETWNNSKYDRWISEDGYEGFVKERNVREFLSACGFTNVECTELDKRPTNDSIGYTIGSKEITVWNAETQKNETYTLIAVGVRGAGYGQEWANNVSIGDPATRAMPANGRHWGFDDGAIKVCSAIRTYLSAHSISGNVKYWITGFSRAAAVANLAAGYLTDNGSAYQTQQKDVFAYTWECPQAASTRENALNYKNIHNILNPMDAVPKVSPDAFEHQRLGVDYQMPYHATPNLSSANHTAMYNRMFEVLKTIAVGNGTDPDPLVDDKTTNNVANDGYVSPNKYPYKNVMTIYKMSVTQLLSDAASDKLMTNFGAERAEQRHGLFNLSGNVDSLLGWNRRTDYQTTTWYLDDFIDHLVTIFLTSNAWIGQYGIGRTALENRTTFISDYQEDFRTLFGYFLDFSGPAFMELLNIVMEKVEDQLKLSNAAFAINLGLFYASPTTTRLKTNLINSAKPLAVEVADEMTQGFTDPQGITRAQMHSAMEHLVELVINLYAYELSEFDSQYLGTTLKYLNTILCTHEQETVLSWIMSLDQNHMNRSCRTITIPAGCDATVYEYRPQYAQYEGSMDDAEAKAPPVAELENGTLNSKDGRITLYQENGGYVIRYPASLQIRVDVKPNQTIHLNSIAVDDYETRYAYIAVSDGQSQFQNKPLYNTYNTITQQSGKTNAAAKNTDLSGYGTIDAGDTLHVIVNDMQTFNSGDTVYELLVDKAPQTTVVDYGAPSAGLAAGSDADGAVRLGIDTTVSSSTDASLSIPTRKTQITVPASNVYFDDELTTGSAADYTGETTRMDWNDETQESVGKLFWYKFRGTRIDLYCTTDSATGYVSAEIYENNGGAVGERVDIQAIKSSSDTTRYNVPTISFDGLNADQDYYLRIYAIKGSNYRLDGIRVYHAADETDSAVRSAYEAAGEQNAKYVNLRALLLGSVSEDTLSADGNEGAVFYTDSGESYALTSDEYQNDSPKNEIYLKHGEKVAFQIVGEYEKVAIGLSAPDSVSGGGSVRITDGNGTKTLSAANALDQYYIIEPAPDGSVVIENTGSAMISITNVKLSGDYTPPAFVESVGALRVSKSLMRYAADFSQLPTSTEPEPTPDLSALIRQLISTFVESLFSSISRLFDA